MAFAKIGDIHSQHQQQSKDITSRYQDSCVTFYHQSSVQLGIWIIVVIRQSNDALWEIEQTISSDYLSDPYSMGAFMLGQLQNSQQQSHHFIYQEIFIEIFFTSTTVWSTSKKTSHKYNCCLLQNNFVSIRFRDSQEKGLIIEPKEQPNIFTVKQKLEHNKINDNLVCCFEFIFIMLLFQLNFLRKLKTR